MKDIFVGSGIHSDVIAAKGRKCRPSDPYSLKLRGLAYLLSGTKYLGALVTSEITLHKSSPA